MDNNTDNVAVEHGARSVDVVRALKLIDAKVWPAERLQWIWEHVKAEKYSSDDLGDDNAALFIANLFAPCTEHYEFRDAGYIAMLNLLAGVNADIHFCMWDEVTMREIKSMHSHIYQHLIDTWNIHRMTAYVPEFNREARRTAFALGYKYEGTIRQMFLKDSIHHDLEIYGLLRSEFERM